MIHSIRQKTLMPEIMVYILDTELLKGSEDRLLPLIPAYYKDKYEDTSNAEAKLQELGAGYLLYKYMKLDNNSTITKNECGKPKIDGDHVGEHTEFSISHSDNFVALAISPIPVGVDIENAERITLPILRIVLPPADFEQIKNNSDKYTFAKYWTKVEAVLKARGTGFLLDPRTNASFMDGWYTESEAINENHMLSCAAERPFNMTVKWCNRPLL
ncbi:MAG: 4'-phosphopantetheinyl transferase superfamily protein [Lachnospiraceae bacterium]|nr:4'-phosphopantetheinyl transferase superfamily protein [Lachnospiraceae bacterium]